MIGRAIGFVVRRGFKLGLFASALLVGGVLAHAIISEPVRGSGKAVTQERKIGNATELSIIRGDDIEIVQGDMPSVRITADDNILPLLETRNHNGKLTFDARAGFSIREVTPITYRVVLPEVQKISVSGTGNVKAAGLTADSLTINLSGAGKATLKDITCNTLTLSISGVGNTTLTGKVDKLVVKLSGAGDVDAQGLQAKSADTQISGAGTAKVWATTALKAKISGAGSIQYRGNPQIEQKVSGAGSVKQIGG